uniref:B30.2/SPRY domain-containing protein n=1 Tax=Poecilia mexicana TaxID=48701 RepID=A0A3B3X2K4_9TELE
SPMAITVIFFFSGCGLHLIGSSQPIVAAPGDDVILPCRVEPEWDAVGKTVEWSRPDLRPTGPQKRVEYVFVYRFRKTDRDMMMDTYIQRTSLSQDGLRRGDVSLTIRNVSLQDQGRFRCFIPRLGIEAELLLVVGEERVQTAGSDPDLLDFFSSVLLLLLFQIQTLRKPAGTVKLKEIVLDVLRDTWTNISLKVTGVDVLLAEPKTRDGFLHHSKEITLDPNTANRNLFLSEGNRKVIRMMQQQFYLDNPDRFTDYKQVLSRESLTGRCYWEVEWTGRGVGVAVSYQNIRRSEGFGFNDKSWSLYCTKDGNTFFLDDIETPVPGPVSSRIGVYLDHRAGILSFYSVSGTMTLLHRVQTRFTQPLYAGICVYNGSSAELIKPQQSVSHSRPDGGGIAHFHLTKKRREEKT